MILVHQATLAGFYLFKRVEKLVTLHEPEGIHVFVHDQQGPNDVSPCWRFNISTKNFQQF